MTSRERIEAALKHKEPDRTPIFEYLLGSPVADVILGRRFEDPTIYSGGWNAMVDEMGWESSIRKYAIDRVELAQKLNHDMICIFNNPLAPGQKFPPGHVDPISILDHKEELAKDPLEVFELRVKKLDQPEFIPPEEMYLSVYYIQEEMNKRGMDLPILSTAITHGIWTDIYLMQSLVLAPDLAHRYLELCTRTASEEIKLLIKLGVNQIEIGGDFAGKNLMISPECYRNFIVPEVRKIARQIHEAGLYAINASDGNLWEIINDYLAGCEVDGCIEIDSFAGMDLRQLKQGYGDRFTLYGNIDCGYLLSFGSPEEIRKNTIECIEAGLGNGGHILCANNAITKSVPPENYFSMINTYREYFSLPKLSL